MPSRSFEDRLASIAGKGMARVAPPMASRSFAAGGYGPSGGSHKDRVARAVAVAVMLGVPRNHALPFAYAALLRLGVPVRPPHYLSGPTLFVVGFLPLLLLLGGFVESGFGESARFVFFQLIDDAGWPGAFAFALFSGAVNMFHTRAEAALQVASLARALG